MQRRVFIERVLREIYGGQPNDDSTITVNLVNNWIGDATAIAAKQNYKEGMMADDICYVNNSFYSTFKALPITFDEKYTWVLELPEIPIGIGTNFGVSTLELKDSNGNLSYPLVWLSQNQRSFFRTMRPIPNKTLALPQGKFVYITSTLLLNQYTGNVTMISGGDSTDLDSEINVPPDYFPTMVEYLKQQLSFERMQPQDVANDGADVK